MTRIKINGELDHHSAETVRKYLDRAILKSGDHDILLDLTELTFMDSSGVGVLLGRYKLFAARHLFLTGANEEIDRLIRLSGLYTVMPQWKEEAV
ncbi:MAG: anti-sigma factor antagonist [Clostridia bacterium]|nr:anti-sigma factor antagonist [Clostridia bacterium]